MKRFYENVTVIAAEGEAGSGYRVHLDGRPVRTQGGAAQIVPTQALAEAMAEEWRAQPEKIDPRRFPFRDLADYAIDKVDPERAEITAALLNFAATDTLCYRAEPGEPLFRRQQEEWEPLVTRCEAAHAIEITRISGVLHRPQPEATTAAFHAILSEMDAFTLAGLQSLTSLAASLIIGLAALEESADAEALFAAANLEQDWQAERWGWDHQAEQIRAARAEAFRMAADFVRLARA